MKTTLPSCVSSVPIPPAAVELIGLTGPELEEWVLEACRMRLRAERTTALVTRPDPDGHELAVVERSARVETAKRQIGVGAEIVFKYWQLKMGKRRALFDAKRQRRLAQRLEENGCDLTELLNVVDGATHDPWLMGLDPRSPRRYDGIEVLFRDREQVERLFELSPYAERDIHPFLEERDP